eukprot:TRINITY_DN5661_c0_g7_i1.p1 TRINITY_DN5661_c0_g7~~TRINITY_DN5661_c0_g7_i1.p1  ORF type:complete len:415 (+),score=104.05 TRINITY_DN5661_c0_g7_i1:64-1245(+)
MMMRTAVLLVVVCSAAGLVVTPPRVPEDVIPGEYIVVLKKNVTDRVFDEVSRRIRGEPMAIGSGFKAVFARMEDAMLQWALHHDNVVASIEHNMIVKVANHCPAVQTKNVSWGQTRCTTSSAEDALDSFAHDPEWGTGVNVYVLDTGVRCTHQDLTGKCTEGANTAGGTNADNTGHGTHVAGIVSGTRYGVSKSAHIISVKVLGDNGAGTTSSIIQGLQWATTDMKTTGKPSVATMAFEVELSSAINNAVSAAVNDSMHMVVAAGNNGDDACNYSPASDTNVITVSSTELGNSGGILVDARTSFANYGRCVDLFAPGSTIVAAFFTSDTSYASLSGTSMATPHVAAAVAVILTSAPTTTPANVKQKLIDDSLKGIVMQAGTATPNNMLHINCF